MKTLYIVRHGKSSWENDGLKDFDRPLKYRGVHDAEKMAVRLKEKNNVPEIIITSTANRALTTARIFSRIMGVEDHMIYLTEELYLASVETILDVIYSVEDEVESVMIFGHNPGFTGLAIELSNLNIDNIPTSGLVKLDFSVNKWTEISKQHIASEFFDYPKNA